MLGKGRFRMYRVSPRTCQNEVCLIGVNIKVNVWGYIWLMGLQWVISVIVQESHRHIHGQGVKMVSETSLLTRGHD